MLRLLRAPYSGASASNMWMGVLQHVKIVLSVDLFELLSVLCHNLTLQNNNKIQSNSCQMLIYIFCAIYIAGHFFVMLHFNAFQGFDLIQDKK